MRAVYVKVCVEVYSVDTESLACDENRKRITSTWEKKAVAVRNFKMGCVAPVWSLTGIFPEITSNLALDYNNNNNKKLTMKGEGIRIAFSSLLSCMHLGILSTVSKDSGGASEKVR